MQISFRSGEHVRLARRTAAAPPRFIQVLECTCTLVGAPQQWRAFNQVLAASRACGGRARNRRSRAAGAHA